MPCDNTAPYKRFQRVLPRQCNYTTNATKQRTRLYSGFSSDCTRSIAHDTRPTQADIMPSAGCWRAYTRPNALHLYQIPPPRRDAAQVCAAAYYNKVYKRVQGCACYGSMPDGAAYRSPCQRRRGQLLPCADRWQVLHPAHLLRGQRLHLCRVSPAGSRCFTRPAAGGLAPGQRSGRGSPAAGSAAGGAEPLAASAASLFGLSPDSQ